MPKEPTARSSRQRPISCRFCRSRKLRCSREAPCSNCTSRGISCELEVLTKADSDKDGASKAELLDRIRKLEELVDKVNPNSRHIPISQHSPASADEQRQQTYQTPNPDAPSDPNNLRRDVAYLESVYDAGGTERADDQIPHDKFRFHVCPVLDMIDRQRPEDFYSLSSTAPGLLRHVWLPEYSEAKILLQKFIQHVGHFHQAYHTPSLSGILERFYSRLDQRNIVKSGEAILMLSIFTSSTHSWTQTDCCQRALFTSPLEAHKISDVWSLIADDLVHFANRNSPASIECIQGMIILLFCSKALEGFSRRCRSFTTDALSLARELGLHCIDHPSNAHLANTVQAEVGRRAWWWLVATDWAMAARFNDVPMGVYTCHLRHMMTNKPLNLDDEYLIDGMSRVDLPPSQPTAMSYSLQRIRMAEIARNVVDRTSLLTTHISDRSYHIVMDIDAELQQTLNNVPPFFSMRPKEMERVYLVDQHRAMCVAQQGHKFYSLLYALRCKLHLPYLSRAYTDSEYAMSRDVCMQSARLIIQTESDLEVGKLCEAHRYKPIGLIMSVFIACIVLFIDLCHSKDSSQREKQLHEIGRAFRMLEDARHESDIVAKFLDSMLQVLHKHKIAPPKLVSEPTQTTESYDKDNTTVSTQRSIMSSYPSNSAALQIPMLNPGAQVGNGSGGMGLNGNEFTAQEELPYLSELTQTLNQGININDIDWDDIFLDLDAPFF